MRRTPLETLTNTIEAILFASGKAVAIADIAEKLGVTLGEVKKSLKELQEHYGTEGGIQLLEFNKKAQLASNPAFKDEISAVLNPIREKELTRTILECAAIVAYKQPITRTEIEMMRGVNSNYGIDALLELKLIYPCGRKDAVGHPVLFATTDEFLKRFKLQSLAQLPDYDTLMEKISTLGDQERDAYLYARDEYVEEDDTATEKGKAAPKEPNPMEELSEGGYEIPDFLRGLDDADIVKIS